MDEEIKDILSKYIIKGIDPYFSWGCRSNLRYAAKEYSYAVLMEPNPKGVDILDYLYFAKADLLSKDLRGAINALENAKRAIHLLVDSFLELLGLKTIYGEDNFPTKLEIIQKLEAFPTRLLKTLNKRRNLIEHEYDQLELDEAEGFVETAELFVRLCYPYFKYTTIGTRVGEVNSNKDIEWLLDPEASEIIVSECQGASKLETELYGTIYYELKTKPGFVRYKPLFTTYNSIVEKFKSTFPEEHKNLSLEELPLFDEKGNELFTQKKLSTLLHQATDFDATLRGMLPPEDTALSNVSGIPYFGFENTFR